jgi:integrase
VADYSNWKNRDMDYRTGHRLDKCSVGEILRAIGKKCNIPNVHPHRFRRTTATLALKRGMKITDVQRMLGHSDIKTTTIYAISNDEEVKREHEKYLI